MKQFFIGLFVLASLASLTHAADDLAAGFKTPPAAAKSWVYWFSLSGNLTREGITADFEAMARVGIGGVLYMEVDQGAPKGAADFAGPLWMDMFSHACREAKRLGLEINMNNDAGWNGSGGPWITPELSMQKVVWSEVVPDPAAGAGVTLPQPKAERGFYQDIAVLAMPAPTVDALVPDWKEKSSSDRAITSMPPLAASFAPVDPGASIPRGQVVDLTGKMDGGGKLDWNAPTAGKWLVMRFGHTTTGVNNSPAPATGRGLECDKLSKEAATFHFQNLMGRIIERNRGLTGQDQSLVAVHIDSWENGAQNCTPRLREEFRRRCGYDLLPFLPAFSGRYLDGAEVTERFLWDLLQTVSELLVENYAGTFKDLAYANGLRFTVQAYDGPCANLPYAGQSDEPMGEFWNDYLRARNCTEMASAGHTYGKRIIGAEACTSNSHERWQLHPGNIKALGDGALCEGINRFVIHRYAAQPFLKAAPGMSMGPWGRHYERTQTW